MKRPQLLPPISGGSAMLLIQCPWCGLREQVEFTYGGEAHIARPACPGALSDEEWGDYLFFRKNPKQIHYERWFHAHACRRWLYAARSTITNEILVTYKPDDPRPVLEEEGPA